MKIDILGVKIDDVTIDEALETVSGWFKKSGKYYIVTPNPEFIVAAQKDELFKKVLNNADLSIPDGAGLRLSGRVKNTVTGMDLMEKLITLAAEKGFTTGFLGGKEEIAKKTAECLKKKYPRLKVVFAESGGDVDDQGNILRPSEASGEVTLGMFSANRSNNNILPVDLLFVAFGHIKQEKWIARNLSDLPVKIAMGVGGAFDYLSGSVPRAPMWLRAIGFEWLFRLIVQPWRIRRQLALLKFIFYMVK